MGRKTFLLLSAVILIFPVLFRTAYGAEDNWKAEQKKMFEQIGLKPGEIVDRHNWEKIKDVLPISIVNWVKAGKFIIPIGEFIFDYSPDNNWLDASAANLGKYRLDEQNELVSVTDNKPPLFVFGEPFPKIDDDDPQKAPKLMHDNDAAMSRAGSQFASGANKDMVGINGFEKMSSFAWYKYNFWQRPDGEQPNPGKYKTMEIIPVLLPYDSKGITSMFIRMLDGSDDRAFSYIPTIRRVKRLAGTNRSDPILGSDTCFDDSLGFSGHIPSFEWKYIGEKILLMPITRSLAEKEYVYDLQADGSWFSRTGVEAQKCMNQEGD